MPSSGYAFGRALYAGILKIAVVDYVGGVIALTSETIELTDPAGFARHVDRRIHDLTLQHRLLGQRRYGVGFSALGSGLSRDGNR